MRAKAKKRDATALASSVNGGKVYPPNECSVAGVKVDVPVQVLAHVVAYIIPNRAGRAVNCTGHRGGLKRGERTAWISSTLLPFALLPRYSSLLATSLAAGRQSYSVGRRSSAWIRGRQGDRENGHIRLRLQDPPSSSSSSL